MLQSRRSFVIWYQLRLERLTTGTIGVAVIDLCVVVIFGLQPEQRHAAHAGLLLHRPRHRNH